MAKVSTLKETSILSPREMDVLQSIFEGNNSRQVAEQLGIVKSTVDWHITKMYRKLFVNNRVQLLRTATRLGLLRNS